MSLDIAIKSMEDVKCPHCGEVVFTKTHNIANSCGKAWYPFLEQIGYYVPYDERTEENDWYGKDMALTVDQIVELARYVKDYVKYDVDNIKSVLADNALYGCQIVVNADW